MHNLTTFKFYLKSDIPFQKSVELPTEILDMVATSLDDKKDLAKMCLASKRLHKIACRVMYREITVSGVRARKLFTTVISAGNDAQSYPAFVRSLTYSVDTLQDAFLGSHIFAQALLKMQSLRSLDLQIEPRYSSHLMAQLCDKQVIRLYRSYFDELSTTSSLGRMTRTCCLLTIPRLESLSITGDVRLAAIGKFRRLTRIIMVTPINLDDLAQLVSSTTRHIEAIASQIDHLEINLKDIGTVQCRSAFSGLALTFPQLRSFHFRAPRVHTTGLTVLLAETEYYFDKLESLSVNEPGSQYQPLRTRYFGSQSECHSTLQAVLWEVGQKRPQLAYVRYGHYTWQRPSESNIPNNWLESNDSDNAYLPDDSNQQSSHGKPELCIIYVGWRS